MLAQSVYVASLVALAALMARAAIGDIREYIIPNRLCAVVILLFPAWWMAGKSAGLIPADAAIFGHLMVAAAVFAVGFVLFVTGVMGGGDIKLLIGVGLWAGPQHVLSTMFLISLAGGAVAAARLAQVRLAPQSAQEGVAAAQLPIPYGVAIAIGGYVLISELILNALPQ